MIKMDLKNQSNIRICVFHRSILGQGMRQYLTKLDTTLLFILYLIFYQTQLNLLNVYFVHYNGPNGIKN